MNFTNCSQSTALKSSALENYEAFAFFMDTIVSGLLLCATGLIGNILVIVTLWQDRKKSTTSFLVVALAFADTLYLIHSFMFQSLRSVYSYTGDLKGYIDVWPYIEPYEYPFGLMAQMITIWVVVLLGLERFIAVCKPLRAKVWCTHRRVRMQLACVIVAAIVFAIPRFFTQTTKVTVNSCTSETTARVVASGLGKSKEYSISVNTIFLIIAYLVPLTLLTYINTKLITVVRKSYQDQSKLQHYRSKKSLKQKDKLTLMLIVVIAVFMVCETPVFINHLVYIKGYMGLPHSYFNVVSNTLVTLNSSVNFFIYFLFGKKFRRMMIKKFSKSKKSEQNHVFFSSSSSQEHPQVNIHDKIVSLDPEIEKKEISRYNVGC